MEEIFPVLSMRRGVDRVTEKIPAGKDRQVDEKSFIIKPSYGGYLMTDPFLALSEDWFSSPGFDWHPHRGVETVTVVVDGVLEHGDNLGNAGLLSANDAQWMTAGRGIIHREHAYRDEYAHTLQLLINLPAALKMTPTRYQDLRGEDLPLYTRPGIRIQMMSWGATADPGVLADAPRVLALVLRLEPGVDYSQVLPADHRAFAYVLAGEITIAGRRISAGQTAWSDPVVDMASDLRGLVDRAGGAGGLPASQRPAALPATDGAASYLPVQTLSTDQPAVMLLFSGPPLREPVAAGASFVMNTEDEIRQAIKDYESGNFGQIPRMARL